MLDGRQVLDERLQFGADGLIGDLAVEFRLPDLFAPLAQLVAQLLLHASGGPYQARQAAIGADELLRQNVEGADAR